MNNTRKLYEVTDHFYVAAENQNAACDIALSTIAKHPHQIDLTVNATTTVTDDWKDFIPFSYDGCEQQTCQQLLDNMGKDEPQQQETETSPEKPKAGPTRENVEQLKANWSDDPCWDIEDTEGFEKYKDELRCYRHQKESEWKEKAQARILNKANELGIPENTSLLKYLEHLEGRIDDLEAKLSHHADNDDLHFSVDLYTPGE